MDDNFAVFVNRRKKITTREELEKCSKEVRCENKIITYKPFT